MALKRANPDVVVVNGTRIIAEKVLHSVPATFLNTHSALRPLYRGAHGGYWALVKKDRANCGVTIHVVDAGIDTAALFYPSRIEPGRADNFVTYPYLQLAAAIDLLRRAISEAANGTIVRLPPPTAIRDCGRTPRWLNTCEIVFRCQVSLTLTPSSFSFAASRLTCQGGCEGHKRIAHAHRIVEKLLNLDFLAELPKTLLPVWPTKSY